MTSEERHERRYQRRKQKREEKRLARSQACGGLEEVFSYDNLYASGHICSKGVAWKCSTQQYRLNLVSNTAVTRKQILEGTYRSKGFVEFQLYDRGKWRRIRAVHIGERVVQRTLCDKLIIPVFTPALIYDNGASMRQRRQYERKRNRFCYEPLGMSFAASLAQTWHDRRYFSIRFYGLLRYGKS